MLRENAQEIRSDKGLTLETSKSFMVVIQPLSTCLIKPNFCFDLSHRRSTTVSSETRNSFNAQENRAKRKIRGHS